MGPAGRISAIPDLTAGFFVYRKPRCYTLLHGNRR